MTGRDQQLSWCQAAAMGLDIPVRSFDDTDALDSVGLSWK